MIPWALYPASLCPDHPGMAKTNEKGDDRAGTAAAFGTVVRERRRALGLTQEGLAERAGLSAIHVARIERAERVPTVHAAVLLGRGLGVTAGELVRELEGRLTQEL